MIGSDNVCYVLENKGLSGFNTDITFPKLQAHMCGRNSEASSVEQSSLRVCGAHGAATVSAQRVLGKR